MKRKYAHLPRYEAGSVVEEEVGRRKLLLTPSISVICHAARQSSHHISVSSIEITGVFASMRKVFKHLLPISVASAPLRKCRPIENVKQSCVRCSSVSSARRHIVAARYFRGTFFHAN